MKDLTFTDRMEIEILLKKEITRKKEEYFDTRDDLCKEYLRKDVAKLKNILEKIED